MKVPRHPDGARRRVTYVSLLSLLAVAMLWAPALETTVGAAAASSIWTARVGNTGGVAGFNGTAAIMASWTGTGTLTLNLVKLKPGTLYGVMLIRGPAMRAGTSWSARGGGCAAQSDGPLLRLPAVRVNARGTVTRTIALTVAQMARLRAVPRRVGIMVGAGSLSRCGSFAIPLSTRPSPSPSGSPSASPSASPEASTSLTPDPGASLSPSQSCVPIPRAVADAVDVLSIPDGLCLVEYSDAATAPDFVRATGAIYLPTTPPVVHYIVGAGGGSEFEVIVHELCHAHQDRVARDAGLEPAVGWYATPQGKEWVQAMGWSLRKGLWVQRPDAGYLNPLEDNATTCMIWLDPAKGPRWLRRWAPARWVWAAKWLPLPRFITPWTPSPTPTPMPSLLVSPGS